MHFESACSKEGNGVGVLFMSHDDTYYKFTFMINFDCTNNAVEYETLFPSLKMASKYGIKYLKAHSNLELILSHNRSIYVGKEKRPRMYKNVVWDAIEIFEAFDIKFQDRNENIIVDALAILVSKFDASFTSSQGSCSV